MITLDAAVRGILVDCFRTPTGQTVSDWADAEVYLTEKMASVPGPYDSSKTPYARAVMDFAQDEDADELILGKSSQLGLTEALLNIVRWMPRNDPGPVAYAIDTQEEVKRISDIRLKPTIERMGGNVLTGDANDLKLLTIMLRQMVIYLGGGGSKALYENKFVKFFILDEVENHELNREGSLNASTIDLARERRKTVPGGKLVALGKFGLNGGLLHNEWKSGTREFFRLPCQRCGEMQSLRMKGLKFSHHKDLAGGWDKQGVMQDTRYVCQNSKCGFEHLWHEHQERMNAGGVWSPPTNPNPEPRKRSMQISDLYSPWITWGELAMKLIGSKGDPAKRRAVYNHNFALPWREEMQKVEAEQILALRSGMKDRKTGAVMGPVYRFGFLPEKRICPVDDPAVILTVTDCQDKCYKTMTAAFRLTGEMFVIDYSVLLGLQDVEDAYLRKFKTPGGLEIEPYGGLIDSGFDTKSVYAFCEALQILGKQVFPSKGGVSTSGRLWTERQAVQYGELRRYDYWDYQLKYTTYVNRIKRLAAPRIYLPSDVGDHHGLVSELCSERLETRAKGHQMETRWVAHGANDFGDCLKMLVLAWDIISAQFEGAEMAD